MTASITLQYIQQRMSRVLPGEAAFAVVRNWLKQFLVRFLMVAYGLLILKPVMPLIVDCLAHAFWENVHIAVVHRINGKDHVHYEMMRYTGGLEKEKSGGKYREETEVSPHIAVVSLYHIAPPVLKYIRQQYPAYQCPLS